MYQANDGISLATFFVTEGAWNSELSRHPMIPPKASNGMATSAYISKITTMVPSGRAAVAPYDMATIFRINTVINNGPTYRIPVTRTLFSWRICRSLDERKSSEVKIENRRKRNKNYPSAFRKLAVERSGAVSGNNTC